MKTLFKLSLLLIVLSYTSCSKEEVIDQTPVENNKTTDNVNRFFDFEAAETLKNKKHWLSFLVAQTILGDEDAAQHFNNVLNNSQNNIIDLEELFLEDTPYTFMDLLYQSNGASENDFTTAFREEFFYYYSALNDCGRRPDLSPTPDDEAGHTELFYGYLITVIDINDFHLYLPNGYNNGNKVLSSVDNAYSNITYEHFNRCDIEEINYTGLNKAPTIIRTR